MVVGPGVDPPGLAAALARDGVVIYRGSHNDLSMSRVAAVLDADPDVVMAATARGIDGVIWDLPTNRGFPWHFRAVPDDVAAGLLRRVMEWRGRCRGRESNPQTPGLKPGGSPMAYLGVTGMGFEPMNTKV